MDQKFKTRRGDIVFVLLILVSIAAMVNVFVLQSQYSSVSNDQAVATAEAYSLDVTEKFSAKLDYIRGKTQTTVDTAKAATSKEEFDTLLARVLAADRNRNAEIVTLRYFNGDTEYQDNGNEFTLEENNRVRELRARNTLSVYGIIYDNTKPCIACYCPIENCTVADGLVVFFSKDVFVASVKAELDRDKLKSSEFSAICSNYRNDLEIISVLHDEQDIGETEERLNDSFFNYLEELSADTKPSMQIRDALGSGRNATVSLNIHNERYIAVIGKSAELETGLYVVNLYRESTVYAQGLGLMETSIITMTLLLVVVALFTLYFIISRRRIFARIEALETINPVLQCPTLLKFERDARSILDSHRVTQFAIVVSHLQHFSFLSERYGDSVSTAVLKRLRDVFRNAMTYGETYGYVDGGEFVLMLRYNGDENLEKRLKVLRDLARKHYVGDEIPEDYDVKLLFGIFKVDRSKNIPVNKMVEKAMEVSDLPTRTDVDKICNFYDEHERSDYMIKAEIENRMEAALQTGEFRLFYQPKYSLKHDRIDGAEILVRWYNTETKNYRSPAEFLPVFEENGFIAKLDKTIYYNACETIAKWKQEGKKIYPISVNISRVTAIQPEFLDYYIAIKKKYNIPNGFITLEFTESFAYENYEYLSRIAKRLREEGFLCSIDDFGTGYSSFTILKLLEMDEIKFDKLFLDKGTSAKKDVVISENLINIGKEMGLKTTQEGVETLDDLMKLRAMGCDVIQGYYLAKPMSGSDYQKFIEDFMVENPILAAERKAGKSE